MADEPIKSVSDIDKARARMERAIDRLETALAAQSSAGAQAAETVSTELAGARDEISRLKSERQSVSERLDATIDRIRAVLET